MRRLPAILLSALTVLLLSGAVPSLTPAADAWPPLPFPSRSCPIGGTSSPVNFSTAEGGHQEYLRDDFRLGPLSLPFSGQIGELLRGYDRTGYGFQQMTANDFLECYWTPNVPCPSTTCTDAAPNPNTKIGLEGWRYPPQNGFEPGTNHPMTVTARRKLQLFGNPGTGKFLAPAGTLYRETAIPPSNLDTFSDDFPFNYHLYLVCKDFPSEEGRIAPWFQQPGGGIQDYTGNQNAPFDNVGDLTNAKYLQDITYLPTATTCSA